jgi:hypothetical protein
MTEERDGDRSKKVTCLSDERGQGARLRLVSDRVRSWEWQTLPRQQRSARDRLGRLKPPDRQPKQ